MERECRRAPADLAGINTPLASSMGRLFDAAAAVLGVRQVSHYEGQAAMELEALAGNRPGRELPCAMHDGEDGSWMLDPMPLLTALGRRVAGARTLPTSRPHFHESIAASTAELALRGRRDHRTLHRGARRRRVPECAAVVSLQQRLVNGGLSVLLPRRLGPNDGAVSYGQAAVAAAQLAAERAGAQRRRQEDTMCLGIPGRIVELHDDRGLTMGQVDFGGVRREVCLAYVAERCTRAITSSSTSGFAISRVDEDEAHRTFEALRDMSQLDELEWMREVADRSLAQKGMRHEVSRASTATLRSLGAWSHRIRRTATRRWTLMEVCGGQTHTIVRQGLDELLGDAVEMIHGPGCPVCVTPLEQIDKALRLAAAPP